MSRATGFALRYGLLLAINFGIDERRLRTAEQMLNDFLTSDGLTAEPVTVKRYS